jgi:hypothetical protein
LSTVYCDKIYFAVPASRIGIGLFDSCVSAAGKMLSTNLHVPSMPCFIPVSSVGKDQAFKGGARMLLEAVCAEALLRGVGHGSIHAQVANGFNQKCKHILADRLLRTRWISSWEYAGGKECEYMEWRCDNRE